MRSTSITGRKRGSAHRHVVTRWTASAVDTTGRLRAQLRDRDIRGLDTKPERVVERPVEQSQRRSVELLDDGPHLLFRALAIGHLRGIPGRHDLQPPVSGKDPAQPYEKHRKGYPLDQGHRPFRRSYRIRYERSPNRRADVGDSNAPSGPGRAAGGGDMAGADGVAIFVLRRSPASNQPSRPESVTRTE